jgi:putative polyketide hydroxylase
MWVMREGVKISTLDLYERSFVVLAGSRGRAWRNAAKKASESTGVPVETYLVGTGRDHDLVPEADGDWARLHGTAEDGAVLVRPDGFIAWRAHAEMPHADRILTHALQTALCRN